MLLYIQTGGANEYSGKRTFCVIFYLLSVIADLRFVTAFLLLLVGTDAGAWKQEIHWRKRISADHCRRGLQASGSHKGGAEHLPQTRSAGWSVAIGSDYHEVWACSLNFITRFCRNYHYSHIALSNCFRHNFTSLIAEYFNTGKAIWNKNMVCRVLENKKYIGENGYPQIFAVRQAFRRPYRQGWREAAFGLSAAFGQALGYAPWSTHHQAFKAWRICRELRDSTDKGNGISSCVRKVMEQASSALQSDSHTNKHSLGIVVNRFFDYRLMCPLDVILLLFAAISDRPERTNAPPTRNALRKRKNGQYTACGASQGNIRDQAADLRFTVTAYDFSAERRVFFWKSARFIPFGKHSLGIVVNRFFDYRGWTRSQYDWTRKAFARKFGGTVQFDAY